MLWYFEGKLVNHNPNPDRSHERMLWSSPGHFVLILTHISLPYVGQSRPAGSQHSPGQTAVDILRLESLACLRTRVHGFHQGTSTSLSRKQSAHRCCVNIALDISLVLENHVKLYPAIVRSSFQLLSLIRKSDRGYPQNHSTCSCTHVRWSKF